ncbi:MAG: TetR/AcrR family transcriptional regulator, partial [Acholeplasmatales bacterium]|nr:TetR/AcrR family transcriptional regulator [Acholeplasmatales bacterium]
MEYKEDIRIQKTRRDLRKAILDLITEKSIEKISVKEICDKAMVNRITFYKYYEDKFTLLDDTINEIRDE